MSNTDSMKTHISSPGAKSGFGDEKDLPSTTVTTSIPQTLTENQMSAPKSNTLNLSKHLSRDSSIKALSGTQQTVLMQTGAPTASNAKLILPTGTAVRDVVPQPSSTKSSNAKQADVSLSISQSLCQPIADSSPSSHFVQSVQVPTSSGNSDKVQPVAPAPVLLLVPNLVPFQGQVNTQPKMMSPLPIVDHPSTVQSNGASTSQMLYCKESEKTKDNRGDVRGKRMLSSDIHVVESETLNDVGLNWDPEKEFMQFLLTKEKDDQMVQIDGNSQVQSNLNYGRKRKRKMEIVQMVDFSEMENPDMHLIPKKTAVNLEEMEHGEAKVSVVKPKYLPAKKNLVGETGSNLPKETVEAIKQLIFSDYKFPVKNLEAARTSVAATAYVEETLPFGSTVFPPGSTIQIDDLQTGSESPSDDDTETEPSFYPCTKCNVNFREKKHLQRHMIYHLEGHSKTNLPRPYICKECGIAFRDRAPLQKHRSLHQEKRERLMEEIRELRTFQDEGRNAKLQCPQCVFGTNCPKTFVQHAKTHEKDKRYYCCDKCNFMAASMDELEGHQIYIHDAVINKSIQKPLKGVSLENLLSHCKSGGIYVCRKCPFTTPARSIFKKHVKYLHQRLYHVQHKNEHGIKIPGLSSKPFNLVSDNKATSQESEYLNKFVIRGGIKRGFEEPDMLGNSSGLYNKVTDNAITQKPSYTATKNIHHSSDSVIDYSKSSTKVLPGLNSVNQKVSFLHQDHVRKQGEIDIKGNNAILLSKDHAVGYQNLEKSENDVEIVKDFPPSSTLIETKHTDIQSALNFHQSDAEEMSGETECADAGAISVRKSVKDVMVSVSVGNDILDQYPDVFHKAPVVVLNKLDPCANALECDGEENSPASDIVETANCMSDATALTIAENDSDIGDKETQYFSTEVQLVDENGIGDDDDFDTYDESEEDDDFDFDNDIHDYGNNDYGNQSLYSAEYQDVTRNHFINEDFHINNDAKCIEVMDPVLYQRNAPLNITYNWTDFHTEKRPCPYCPAVFDTGVGLSNHVRGHLYRVGLTYDARHLVPPEQIASSDKRRRIKKNDAPVRRIKKEVKSGSSTENTCPLCGGWFDTKVGLSNHVRGHLKRLGKTELEAHKSPLSILTEMMQNEAEAENIAKLLSSKQFRYKPFVSQKFATSDGLFLAPNGITIKLQQNEMKTKSFPLPQSDFNDDFPDLQPRKYSEAHEQSSSLMQILKNKFGKETSSPTKSQPGRGHVQTAKKRLPNHRRPFQPQFGSSVLQPSASSQPMTSADITYQTGHPVKLRTCVHCHATFTSAVSLANHLRVYARRKQAGDLTGTPFDCKQKRSRSRSGTKKKSSLFVPSLDDAYVLKCRFCDLVFRGPLSVQEDWIKHLQRHVVNANLPRTGAGMVEISLPSKENFPVTESSFSLLMAQTAS